MSQKRPFLRQQIEIMEILKNHEKKVLNLLASDVFSSDELNSIVRDCQLVGYEYTGCGYFLEISHSNLPKNRIVCDRPFVIGEADDIVCGFIVFIENGKLLLECHTWGKINVTNDFRNRDVQVKATIIEDGKFVDLKSLF